MITVTKEFDKYYKTNVVIKGEVIRDLRDKKKKNIDRLKSGIEKYNEDNNTDYKMIDSLEQGSVAMSTLVQSDEEVDYDIDVAVVFDKNKFADGSDASKNIFIDMVKANTSNFKKEPEKLTNCIRIYYEDGYHLDFALFRSDGDNFYEHAGSNWSERNPREVNNWFREQNANNNLRKYTRLLKYFCKKKSNMPGGFIITILVNEALQEMTLSDNSDNNLIEICKSINNKLNFSTDVINPVAPNNNLTELQKYKDQVNNLNNNLKAQIQDYNSKMNSRESLIEFWGSYFSDTEYWNEDNLSEQKSALVEQAVFYEDNEDILENFFKLSSVTQVEIKCQKLIEQSPNLQNTNTTVVWAKQDEIFNLSQQRYNKLRFEVIIPSNVDYNLVLWKVKNNGTIAEKQDSLRGEIYTSNYGKNGREEPMSFEGHHYVECYVLNGKTCVAKKRYNVTIEK